MSEYHSNPRFSLSRLSALLLGLLLTGPAALAGTITYYCPDAQGNPIAAADAQGNIIWRKHFTPYGKELNGVPDDLGYTGHEYDQETGLTYMQARYYDPIGRFLSPDPVGFNPNQPMTFNRYSYANNNPYKFIDPNGQEIVLATNPNVSNISMADLEYAVESTISSGQAGSSVISQLAASEKVWTITATRSGGESQAIASNSAAGTIQANGAPNKGSNGTLLLNFGEEKVWISTEPGQKGEATAISIQEKVVHEGQHAVDWANGVMPEKGAVNPQTGNPEREQRAMDTENKYREEQDLEGTREVY